jgi:uncharacterized membrane protein YcaP (DUF421 family)
VNGLPGLGSGPLDIVVRTAIIYLFVVLGLRLGGKREVGQLSLVDLVALLLLANAVQNAMVGDDTSLPGGVIAALTILVSARVVDIVVRRFREARKLVMGEPRVLVYRGSLIETAMRREDVSMDELVEALHEHGLEYVRQVKLAILEVDGSISIIPEPEAADLYQAGGGPDTGSRRAGRIPRRGARHAAAPAPKPSPAAQPASKAKASKETLT